MEAVLPRLALASIWLLWLAAGTGCSQPCVDRDGDGYGAGCSKGADCDDHNPALTRDCGAAARKCTAAPFTEGCPCLADASRQCYAADESTIGVGRCRAGRQSCPTGEWSACEGAVVPHFEECNGQDDDCDGVSDEGVLSPCGGCNAACSGGVWGPAPEAFEAGGELDVTATGELTLVLHPSESHTVWVPNTGEATLSKVDADSAHEVARYRVAGDTPERVAVDYQGDSWVLSPSLAGQSMLTKVAAGADRCVDRDGNGLQSSSGAEDVLPLGQDECVLLQVPAGAPAELARALAIDGTQSPDTAPGGHVWLGLQAAERLVELDGASGRVLREVATPGFAPFDAVSDRFGALWWIDRQGLLARVDGSANPPTVEVHEAPLRCYLFDSLASDLQGVLTLTGFSCEDVVTYDPRRDLWRQVQTTRVLDTRGVTVLGEHSWVTHTAGRISRVTRDPLAIDATFELASDGFSPLESIATGTDALGQLWIVSSMGAANGNGLLTRFDPLAESVTAQVPLGRLPRGQGDITGDRRLGELAPEASAQHVFDGCGVQRLEPGAPRLSQPTDWLRLHVAADAGVRGSVLVEARHALSRDLLDGEAFTALGTLPGDASPYELGFATGGVVEVRLTLRSGGHLGAPRIARVGVEWRCPGPE
jgi:streptogramin lyase